MLMHIAGVLGQSSQLVITVMKHRRRVYSMFSSRI